MSKRKINYLLSFFLLVLIIIYGIARIDRESNYYQLNDVFYLHKIDYFSTYSISTKNNNDFDDIIKNVVDVAINKNEIIVRYLDNDETNIAVLRNDSIIYHDIGQIPISELSFSNPWQIVEKKTLSSSPKLLDQILIICIIVLGFYLIMRLFNLRRLIKSP
jgi:hypothetical protein